jgi:hypothetical protein
MDHHGMVAAIAQRMDNGQVPTMVQSALVDKPTGARPNVPTRSIEAPSSDVLARQVGTPAECRLET